MSVRQRQAPVGQQAHGVENTPEGHRLPCREEEQDRAFGSETTWWAVAVHPSSRLMPGCAALVDQVKDKLKQRRKLNMLWKLYLEIVSWTLPMREMQNERVKIDLPVLGVWQLPLVLPGFSRTRHSTTAVWQEHTGPVLATQYTEYTHRGTTDL